MKLTSREPTPEMVEAERVKFEAWCDAEGIDASYWLRCDKHTGYENGQTADYWTGWKARARHSTAPTVEAEPVAFVDAGELRNIGVGGFEPTISKSPVSKWDVPLYTHPAAPQPLQGGMSNNELLSQWKKKLPCVKPSECELSAFAVGAEVGFARARDLERQDWDRVHHTLAKHGEHPGRTDDHLADVIDRALTRLKAAAPQP